MDAREIWIRLNVVSRLPVNKAIKVVEYLQSLTQLNRKVLLECGLSEQTKSPIYEASGKLCQKYIKVAR